MAFQYNSLWFGKGVRTSVMAVLLMLLPFAPARAAIINLVCQVEYGNSGTTAMRNWWIDTDKRSVVMGGWVNIQGEDPDYMFMIPGGVTIDPGNYSWEVSGNHYSVNRSSGIMSWSNWQYQGTNQCSIGSKPMPTPKF